MDRSINSTCNKQTIASEISISNVSFVQSRLEIIFRRVAMLKGLDIYYILLYLLFLLSD